MGKVAWAMASTMLAGIIPYCPAAASSPANDSGVAVEQEAIVVTGSRIARRDFVSDSPLATISGETLGQTGSLTPDAFLNSLPQVVPGRGATSVNPSGLGRSEIDLRGLGANRNLVLVNSRRMIGSDASLTVDINAIPTSLIERVEIISGGASAAYGSDAISGVVNFILKGRFEGVELESRYALSGRGDAKELGFSGTVGTLFGDGRGSVIVALGYSDRSGLLRGDRRFSAQPSVATSYLPEGVFHPFGNNPDAATVDRVFGRYGIAAGGVAPGDALGFNADGTLFSVSLSASAPPVANYRGSVDPRWIALRFYPGQLSYNAEAPTTLSAPLERFNAFATARFELTDDLELYGQSFFTRYSLDNRFAASFGPFSTGVFDVPVTNPYIPGDLRELLASRPVPDEPVALLRRFNELGQRRSEFRTEAYQLLAGIRGSIGRSWRWDAYLATGGVSLDEANLNLIDDNRVRELLEAPDGGRGRCGTFNPFGAGGISAACADYIRVNSESATTIKQTFAELTASGTLFSLPAGDVGLAVGAFHWRSSYDYRPDGLITPDVSGLFGNPPLSGRVSNWDLFGEARVPLLRDLPFVDALEVTLGYRRSEHSRAGAFDSYKAEGRWSIVKGVSLRGSFQRAVRAPNIDELFAAVSQDAVTLVDPCNFDSPQRTGAGAPSVRALCLAQGIPASAIDTFESPQPQVISLVGGNRDLNPERGRTVTLGAVVDGRRLGAFRRLGLSVDYFDIRVEDVISSIDAATIVSRCFNGGGSNPTYDSGNFFCGLFTRRPSDRAISNILETAQNLASLRTNGIDVQADAELALGKGALNFTLFVSWLDEFRSTPLRGLPSVNLAGTIGTGLSTTRPEWKGLFSARYSLEDFGLTGRVRFIDAMKHAQRIVNPASAATGVPETWYFDAAASFSPRDDFTLTFGIDNLFDQQPRTYSPSVQAQTDPSTYDVYGRRFYVSARTRF